MISAPIPSVRLADSVSRPLVRPTTIITSVTSTATAITVMIVRTGRCRALRKIMCPITASSPPEDPGGAFPWELSPTFTSSAPGGFLSTNRSSGSGSLNVAFVMPICRCVIIGRPAQRDLARIFHRIKRIPASIANIRSDLPTGIVSLKARYSQVDAIEPNLARYFPIGSGGRFRRRAFGSACDPDNRQHIILATSLTCIFHQHWRAVRNGLPEDRAREMLRAKILNGLCRSPLKICRPRNELILGRNKNVECLPVALHIENICADDGRLPDHADLRGLFRKDESTHLMVLLNHSGVG